jgi:hypothetical protein
MAEVTREQLEAALDHQWVYAANREGTHHGQVVNPVEAAGELWEKLTAAAEPKPPHSPGYYDGKTGMQPFDVIDEFGLDFYEGNVVKYLVRWRKKNGLEDLRKARTYLNRIIARAEAGHQ